MARVCKVSVDVALSLQWTPRQVRVGCVDKLEGLPAVAHGQIRCNMVP